MVKKPDEDGFLLNIPNQEQFKKSLVELDSVVGELLDFLEIENLKNEYEIMLISEYEFMEVNHSISPNLILFQEGLLSTRKLQEVITLILNTVKHLQWQIIKLLMFM